MSFNNKDAAKTACLLDMLGSPSQNRLSASDRHLAEQAIVAIENNARKIYTALDRSIGQSPDEPKSPRPSGK